VLASDPAATQKRYEALAEYMDADVLSVAKGFCCRAEASCRGSLGASDAFAAGQLSHVGRHYDLAVDRHPFRILVLGMDTGRPDGGVSLDQRRQQIYDRIPERLSQRNAHMRGTSLALRVLLAREAWDDPEDERLDGLASEPVHMLDAYAMANSRLCSAFKPGSTKSKGTPRMSANCLPHLRATLEALEPQVIVIQGAPLRDAIKPLVRQSERLGANLERVEVAEGEVLLASFAHPTAWGGFNWSRPSSPYFQSAVLPTLREARGRALDHRT
jgi:hypothetical protein